MTLRPDELEKLLGGWATGTLAETERSALLDASLTNQALFDALADEEELRALMADPRARARLLAALGGPAEQRKAWWQRLWSPVPIAAMSASAVALLAFFMLRPVPLVEQKSAPVPMASNAPAPAPEPPMKAESPKPVGLARRRAEASSDTAVTAVPPLAAASNAPPPAEVKEKSEVVVARSANAAPPPQPATAAADEPAAAPAAAVETEARKATAPATPPLRYWVERRQQDGSWVQFGEELTAGDAARVIVEARQPGLFKLASGSTVLSRRMTPGERLAFPESGVLPAGRGARQVSIAFARVADTLQDAAPQPQQAPAGDQVRLQQPFRSDRMARLGKSAPAPASAAAPPPDATFTVNVVFR